MPRFRLIAISLLCLLASLASTDSAVAQRVSFEPESPQAFVNEPTRVFLRIEDVEDFKEPELPKIEGAEIRRLPGQQSSTSMQIVNGRTTRRSTIEITYEVTPKRTGTIEIPALAVPVGDGTLATTPFALRVVVSETGDLMIVRVASRPDTLYVGQQGFLDLEIAVRTYRDERLGISLDEGQMWSLIDGRSEFGTFAPALQKLASENRRPLGHSIELDGLEYFVYTMSRPFDPIASGAPDVGDIRIRMQYPTALRRAGDAFFGDRLSLAGARPISAEPASIDVAVATPPDEGRPAAWNGAVGDFDIEVTAKPLEAAVGDPITITMSITDRSGTASLAGLLGPSLSEQATLARNFRVSAEGASGTIDGRTKVFTQTIRALDDTVRAVPPIDFPYFDPASGVYRLAQSDAIPIVVKPSAIVRVERPVAAPAEESASGELTRVEGGILANASVSEASAATTADLLWVASTAVLPLAVIGVGLCVGRIGGLAGDTRAAAHRKARPTADAALAGSPSAEAIESALLGFVAARCGAEITGIARKDAIGLLVSRAAPPQTVAALESLLRECERARYAGGAVDATSARSMLDAIEAATQTLDVPAGGGR